jgi:hypothetical protein
VGELLDYTPIAAAAFATLQFLPQILKLRATEDPAGVSWSWAALTSVNNAAWITLLRDLGVLVGACAGLLRIAPGWGPRDGALPTRTCEGTAGGTGDLLGSRSLWQGSPSPAAPLLVAGFTVAAAPGWARCLPRPSFFKSHRRSGPPAERITRRESHAEPGCSSNGSRHPSPSAATSVVVHRKPPPGRRHEGSVPGRWSPRRSEREWST